MTLEAPECSNFVLELVEELDSSLPEPRTDAILNSTKGAQGFVGFLAKKREIGASATVFLLGGGGVPRQNAVRMSKELSFRSVTHFRLRSEIIGKQIKLPHREVQNQKVRLRKEK